MSDMREPDSNQVLQSEIPFQDTTRQNKLSNHVDSASTVAAIDQGQLRQRQGKNPTRGGANRDQQGQQGDGSPVTVSLADDHFDQYAIRRAVTLGGTAASSSTMEPRNQLRMLHRNRPSLIRQNEVEGSGTPSPVIGGDEAKTGDYVSQSSAIFYS
jgi:hypothetical protein